MSIKHFARLLPLVLLFLLPNLSSAATESIRIIRQDCTGYTNCYTSLSAWEAAENRDLTATDEIAVARIEGVWTTPDTTAVTIDGWTTDATRYVKIYTTPEARHSGVWSTGKYRLEPNDADALKIKDDYVTVEGLQIGITNPTIQRKEFSSIFNQNGVVTLSHSIIRGSGVNSVGVGVSDVTTGSVNLYNNIIYNVQSQYFGGVRYSGQGILKAYNNTIVNSYYGIRRSGGTVISKNNIIINAISSDYLSDSGIAWGIGSNYNISSDGTSTGGANDKINQTVTFADSTNNNYHLASSDVSALNAGVDLSTDPLLSFTTDIDGETRSGAWDIGADETSGGGTLPAGDTTAPSIPTNLATIAISSSQINLSWSASTDNTGVAGYRIYRDGTQLTTTTGTTYSNTGLSASTLYTYTVAAYDAAGNTSSQSTSVSATTQAGLVPDTTAPSIPTNLTASAISSSQINLSWTASTDAVGVTGYTIYRNGTQLTTTTGTTYSNTGLSASTLYAYTVSAYDLSGNASPQSSGASATTQAPTVVTTTTTGVPIIFYTDITSGPNTGGENNNGAYLSIFGKNFGTNISNVKVSVGNGEVIRYIYLGASLGRPDVQQLSVQLGPNTTTGAIKVTVGGVDSNADQMFTVRAGDFYYVSKTGSDTTGMVNDINRPYRTANYVMALSTFADNDFMVIRGGNYDISSGQENLYNNRWINLGVGQGGGLRNGTSDINRITIYGYPGENTTIDWGTITTGGISGIRTVSSTSYYTMANLSFDLKNSGGEAFFLGFYSSPGQHCNYCNVINTKVSGGMAGATAGVTPVYFHRVDNFKLYGMSVGNQSLLANPLLASHVIYLSHFYNNADIGWIYVHDNAYGRAALQVAGDNWGTDRSLAWGVNANVRIHDSLFKNLAQEAILFNLGSKEIFIYNNIIDNVVTRNNAFAAVAFRGADLNAGDYYFYNNTVYTDAIGGGSLNGIIQMGYSPQTTYPKSVTLYNNIIYSKSTNSNFYSINHSSFTANKVTSNNNIWFNSTQSIPFMGINDRIINPQLTSPATGDFTPQPISSAIDTGISLVSNFVTKDYFGISRPQGSAYDIGAFEYCTNCTTTTTTTPPPPPVTDTTAPSVPTNLLATVVSPSQVNLSWSASTDSTGVTGYRIYRNGTQITTTTGTTYSNTGLTPSTPYTYTVSAYDGAGNTSAQSTSAGATTQEQGVVTTSGAPRLYFSDMTDGPTSGWENSTTKGAAVTIWGNNFGTTRGSSSLTVCGVTLNVDSDFAEWGATTNPTAARGMQRITFWLKPTMTIGAGTISVTTTSGTSETIPFYCRALGSNKIYYVSNNGSDTNTGLTTVNPWSSAKKIKSLAQGDIAYFRSGTWNTIDDWSAVIDFWSTNHGNGVLNNSITIASYPGELASLGDSSTQYVIGHHGSSGDILNYWTFSKFRMRANMNVTNWGINQPNSDSNVRFIGNDMSTTAGGKTVATFNGGGGGQTQFRFYGNYVCDTGVNVRGETASATGYSFYLGGYGTHNYVYVGWNEFCHNTNGRGMQIYGHTVNDSIDNLYVHDNYIHHNSTTGAILGGGDGGGGSYNYEYLKNVWFYNNIIAYNDDAVLAGGVGWGGNGGNYYLYNNTLYGNVRGFDITGTPHSVQLKNNIVQVNSGSNYIVRGYDCTVCVASNNLYFNGLNVPSWDTYNFTTNPLLVSVNPTFFSDYALQSSSPAVNSGVYISLVTHDFNGISRPQGSAYDIGAYEYCTNCTTTVVAPPPPIADTTAPTLGTISSSVTTTGATISWTTNEAGTSRVEYGLTTSYGNTTSLSASLTSHSHTLSNLSSNTTYHYRVNTTDSAGNTATSQDRTFTTSAVADTTAPSSITDLTTSSLGQTSLTLSWTVPTDTSGIASYDIRYSTTPITSTTFSSATQLTNVPLPTTSGSTQTQYVSVGLTPNTTYSFAIKSTDAVGNVSSLSNIATGTTLSAPTTTSTTASTQTGTVSVPTVSSGGGGGGGYTIYQLSDVTPPKNPTNVRIEPTNTQATLSWTNPTDPDFVRVKIVRKTGSAVSSHTDGTTVYDGTATTFTDTNLANNQTYYYAIYAYDKVPNYTSFIGLSATPQASLTQTNVSYTTIEAGCTETTTYSTITGKPCTKVPTAFRPFYTFSKDRAVTYGMKDSTDVRELQKILQFEGLLSLTSSADGAFGPGTKSAIIAFQKKYAITPAQGTVGPLTKSKLNQLYGSTTISTTFYRNLTIGSKGEDVKKLQQLLNTDIATRISATGAGSPGNETTYFGAATKAAVMKYQKKNNIIPASGYVGPVTRGKLEGR